MTLRWGHWQPRDNNPEVDRHHAMLLDRLCPKPLMVQLPDGRVMLDEFFLDELPLDDLASGLRRAEERQLLEERPRYWLTTLIELLNTQIGIASAAEAKRKRDEGKIQWGPEEKLEVAPPLPASASGSKAANAKPAIPKFRGPKGGR